MRVSRQEGIVGCDHTFRATVLLTQPLSALPVVASFRGFRNYVNENREGEGQLLRHGVGDALREQILGVTTNLFTVAAVALVAIASTVGVTYYYHERTTSWVEQSRDVSRLARTVYVLTVERELALLNDPWQIHDRPRAGTVQDHLSR